MFNVALIGMGYWGRNLARNLQVSAFFDLKYIVDPQIDADTCGLGVRLFKTSDELPLDLIDAVVIATPIETHFNIAKFFVQKGIHICVAKPLTKNSKELDFLIKLSKEKGVVVFCDYTFIYHPVTKVIKNAIDTKTLGKIVSFESIRSNLGKFDTQSSVVEDLFVHDASIVSFLFLAKDSIKTVKASAASYFGDLMESTSVSVLIETLKGKLITINVSWASPRKTRYLAITGTKQMLVWDDTVNDNKLTFFDRSATIDESQSRVGYKLGDSRSPYIDSPEALSVMLNDFASCINTGVNQYTQIYMQIAELVDEVTLQIKGDLN